MTACSAAEEGSWAHLLSAQGQGRGWEAVHVSFVSDQLLEGLGGVEKVVAELCADLAELLLDLVEALLCLPLEPTKQLGQCLSEDGQRGWLTT